MSWVSSGAGKVRAPLKVLPVHWPFQMTVDKCFLWYKVQF